VESFARGARSGMRLIVTILSKVSAIGTGRGCRWQRGPEGEEGEKRNSREFLDPPQGQGGKEVGKSLRSAPQRWKESERGRPIGESNPQVL